MKIPSNELRYFSVSHLEPTARLAFGDDGPEITIQVDDIREATLSPAWDVAMQRAVEAENARLAGLSRRPIDGKRIGYEWVPEWFQPTGREDAWRFGTWVNHGGAIWRSMIDWNVWEPGVYGWRRQDVVVGPWSAGAGPYAAGDMVTHPDDGQSVWISRRANNVWEPGTSDSGWLRAGPGGPHPWYHVGAEGYPAEWRVTHNGQVWRNPTDGTHWEPGVAVWIDEGPAA